MFSELKSVLKTKDKVYLGDKPVQIKKITPALYKEILSRVESLPGLIINVLLAPKEDFYAYIIQACDIAMDEIVDVVSILSGIDEDYLKNKAGVNEIVEYLVKTLKKNDFLGLVKNVKSLLPKEPQNQIE